MNRLRTYLVVLAAAAYLGLAFVEVEELTLEEALNTTLQQVADSDLENGREDDRLRRLRNDEFFRTGGTFGGTAEESAAAYRRSMELLEKRELDEKDQVLR